MATVAASQHMGRAPQRRGVASPCNASPGVPLCGVSSAGKAAARPSRPAPADRTATGIRCWRSASRSAGGPYRQPRSRGAPAPMMAVGPATVPAPVGISQVWALIKGPTSSRAPTNQHLSSQQRRQERRGAGPRPQLPTSRGRSLVGGPVGNSQSCPRVGPQAAKNSTSVL